MNSAQQFYQEILTSVGHLYSTKEKRQIKNHILHVSQKGILDANRLERALRVALLMQHEIGLGAVGINSILLYEIVHAKGLTIEEIDQYYGKMTAFLIKDLSQAYALYEKNVAIESENFRMLLLSLVSDVRVILIMLIERLYTMRTLNSYNPDDQQRIAREVAFLYAPLAHRMGLYAIKTELEDLSLKYTSNAIYKEIAHKLNATKKTRDSYIAEFIRPLKRVLKENGLVADIKGRTKSIYSIWNKIYRQNTPFEKVYDLFAIRIVLDVPLEKEKSACWQVFSIITDMYTPNTNRLRDWISIPKANGYESLHITVMGPLGKWVEVQIRSQRMDEVAEKGMAAHWKYKGGKSDSAQTDTWLSNLRETLEEHEDNDTNIINEFKMQLYDDDVFIFTPKGDLQRLQKGATLLDFAYSIHSNIGDHCIGGVVNDKHATIKYVLKNGDQVLVQTSANQQPKLDWLNWVVTSKAKSRIRQALKERIYKEADNGREVLQRRLKNWKIECSEADITRESKKMGYKSLSDFYQDIFLEKINLQELHEVLIKKEDRIEDAEKHIVRSLEGYEHRTDLQKITSQADVLEIDKNLKNIDYTLAKCCKPIYGDDIFGFVSVGSGIKIHRKDCPNAPQLIARFGYRIVNARWSGKSEGALYAVTLHVIGHDDVAIVTNITSLISKESNLSLRSISIDTHDGLFEGNISLMISQLHQLDQILKKIKAIKGVKQVYRV